MRNFDSAYYETLPKPSRRTSLFLKKQSDALYSATRSLLSEAIAHKGDGYNPSRLLDLLEDYFDVVGRKCFSGGRFKDDE